MKTNKTKRKYNIDELNISVGSKVYFLFSGYTCPDYILHGTVIHKEQQGKYKSARYLYTVNVPGQEVFKPRDSKPDEDKLANFMFPDEYIQPFTTKILNECVKGVDKYDYIQTDCGVKLYYRKK